jgi:putative sterol carrier protein
MATFQDITTAMTLAVENDDNIKKKFNAVVEFEVDDEEKFVLDASKRGSSSDANRVPDLVVQTSLTVLRELLDKQLTPQQAFMAGKIKVQGKLALGMKLQIILNATRKHLASQSSRL